MFQFKIKRKKKYKKKIYQDFKKQEFIDNPSKN